MVSKRPSLKDHSKEHSVKFFTLVIDDGCFHHRDTSTDAAKHVTDTVAIRTKIPAKWGKSLHDMVQSILERYDMSCETHSLYLDATANVSLVSYSYDSHTYRDQTLYVRPTDTHCHVAPVSRRESKKLIANSIKRFSQLLAEFDSVEDVVDGDVEEHHGELLSLRYDF